MRRAVVDDRAASSVSEATVVERPAIASVIANVVTVLYVAVVSFIGLDTLLRALGARRGNGFVHAVHAVAAPLVAPFRGVFSDQRWWAAALIAAVVYTIVYVLLMAALRRDRTY